MRRAKYFNILIACVVVALLGGCGHGGINRPTGTVTGMVTLNGGPLGQGSITFFGEGDGDTASAILQSDGTYSLKYGKGFSVPTGDYRVAIIAGAPTGAAAPDPVDLMKTIKPTSMEKSPIPDKYKDPKTSTLIAVVKEGRNADINFDLK